MKFTPPLSAILLLIGTTVSLQAIPMFEETKNSTLPREKAAEQQEAAGRRISEPSSSDGSDENNLQRQDQLPQIEDPFMERTSISSSGVEGASEVVIPTTSAEQEHLQASGPAAAGASFEGHSVAATQPKRVDRLAPNGEWEAQHPETKEWQPSERFEDTTDTCKFAGLRNDPNDLQPLSVVTQHYNRAEDIDKRKAACQQELREEQIKNPSPESEHRIFVLQHLISVLEKASAYQNDMVRHLNRTESRSPDPRTALLQSSYRLEAASKINESPNQLERIADQIEIDSQNLLSYQASLNIVQAYIGSLPNPAGLVADPNGRVPRILNSMKSEEEGAITHQRNLITAKTAYATSLPPPYEPRDEATQAGINLRALDCRREAILVRKNHESFTSFHNPQNLREALYAQHEVEARQQVERENQRAQPRQQVIACFTQSADLHQEAFAIDQTGDLWTAQHLSEAGHALSEAAQEAQAIQPRQQIIDLFTQAADLYQQAVAAEDAGDSYKRDSLWSSLFSF